MKRVIQIARERRDSNQFIVKLKMKEKPLHNACSSNLISPSG